MIVLWICFLFRPVWGETPSELQQLTMNVYSNEECKERGQNYGTEITDNMICAGYMEAGRPAVT